MIGRNTTRTRLAAFGFAFVMLVIVAIGIFQQVQCEDVHRRDVFAMRSAIDQYTLDKQRAPRSLSDLVESGYIERSAATDKHIQQLFREAADRE